MSESYQVLIPLNVKKDIKEIMAFYSIDRKDYALRIFENFLLRINSLKTYPERGRIVPELEKQNMTGFRELIESYWRIIYKIEEKKVTIVALIDGRRNVEDILMRKLQTILH